MNAKVSTNNLIATQDPNAFVGAVVMWHLSGDVELSRLQKSWATHGLHPDLLPDLPSAQVCLTRAVEEHSKGNRFKRRIKGEGSSGYRLVREDKADKVVADYDTDCAIMLDGEQMRVVAYERDEDGHTRFNDKDEPIESSAKHPLADKLTAAFEYHKKQLSPRDVSPWLCADMMQHFGATTLKSNGGAYFVPREYVEELKRVKAALSACSGHRIYMIQAMTTDEAVEMVLDAIVREADAEAKAIEADLAQGHGENEDEDSDTKPLGPRALESRADRCRAMVDKVRVYEDLLGRRLDDIRERLGDLKVAAMEASFAAKAQNNKDKQRKSA
jgi:hypothetical protein